jgi:hypothetical protein
MNETIRRFRVGAALGANPTTEAETINDDLLDLLRE